MNGVQQLLHLVADKTHICGFEFCPKGRGLVVCDLVCLLERVGCIEYKGDRLQKMQIFWDQTCITGISCRKHFR